MRRKTRVKVQEHSGAVNLQVFKKRIAEQILREGRGNEKR